MKPQYYLTLEDLLHKGFNDQDLFHPSPIDGVESQQAHVYLIRAFALESKSLPPCVGNGFCVSGMLCIRSLNDQ